ncbi:putative alpha-1,3-glucanase/mutanase [Coniochaeta sp. 2T2.1]|nr:putative alpha-1,3-glucanase/mutanase [Coniochaeta sp. 2T2.1]
MSFLLLARWLGALCLLAGSLTNAAPTRAGSQARAEEAEAKVFCHFMIGIVGSRTSASDYDDDMQRAKAMGIDAFALNIGVDPYTDTQLGFAYDSAAANDMKVFISFDFNWFSASSDAAKVGQIIAKYASKPAQLMVDGKAMVSSFAGDGLDTAAMRAAAGVPVFFAPNFSPDLTPDSSVVDGALNWMAWASDGANKAPRGGSNVTVADGDEKYLKWLNGKPYIAPVSAWFSTHFGPEVSYSKNWVFPGDALWYERWNEILTLKPRFIEIITWNDYGESHYIAPLSSSHYDDGNSKWVNDMTHDGWMDMARPFIAAFKAGSTSVGDFITDDELVYWYRPNQKDLDCDATDTTMVTASNASGNYFMGRPDGFESMKDHVFVVSLLTAPGTVTVTSGDNTQTFEAPAGASIFEVAMGLGQQKFSLTRDSKDVLSGTSLKDITESCICGLYNFNAYVGKLPEIAYRPLGEEGLASLTAGLHVSTCSPAPSLKDGGGGAAPTYAPTTTKGSGTKPTTTSKAGAQPTATSSKPGGGSGPSTTFVTTGPTKTAAPSGAPSPPTSAAPSPSGSCTAGETKPGLSGNYDGLCQFTCKIGYCPPEQCVCTSYGTKQVAARFHAAAHRGHAAAHHRSQPEVAIGISRSEQPVVARYSSSPKRAVAGCPIPTLANPESYRGLCEVACQNGYCPPTACTTAC